MEYNIEDKPGATPYNPIVIDDGEDLAMQLQKLREWFRGNVPRIPSPQYDSDDDNIEDVVSPRMFIDSTDDYGDYSSKAIESSYDDGINETIEPTTNHDDNDSR